MKKGLIITIDGGDRSGKHTQATLLYDSLNSHGYQAELLDFPQYDSFTGALVKDYLSGSFGSKEQLGAKLPSLLYAVDRYAQKEKLCNWLDNGKVVVLDRYTESNMAFQSAKLPYSERKAYLDWLDHLEYSVFGLPRSDIILYLHVPHFFAEQMALKEELETGKKHDIHEKDKDFQKKVIETYLELAKEKNWNVIECVDGERLLSRTEISNKIWSLLLLKLPKQ